jgi:CPA2 family monovalent cation:H+ antiporter-2
LLEAAGLADATAIVLAIDDAEKTVRIARYVSRRHPEVKIVARARDRHHVYQLYAAGAKDSVRETFDSAVRAGKYAMRTLGYTEDEVERVAQTFFEQDRHMLAELAQLWDPDVPIERNAAYVAKAREQAGQIEAALRGQIEVSDKAAE